MYSGIVSHWWANNVRTGSSMKMKNRNRALPNGPRRDSSSTARPRRTAAPAGRAETTSGRSRCDSALRVISSRNASSVAAVMPQHSQLTACTPLPQQRGQPRQHRAGMPPDSVVQNVLHPRPDRTPRARRCHHDPQVHQRVDHRVAQRAGLLVGELLDARVTGGLQDAGAGGHHQRATRSPSQPTSSAPEPSGNRQ